MIDDEDSSSEDNSSEDYELYENNPNEYWSKQEEIHGRDHLIAMNDPYNPDPTLMRYLGMTDSSCTNEELGLNDDGEPEDY